MMGRRLMFLGLWICAVFELQAQDPHFSQFFASPLTLNPAFTGYFNGDLRVAANSRNQWPSFNNAYSTITFSVDGPIMSAKIPSRDRMSIGLMGMSDKSGGGILKENYLGLSMAYRKGLDYNGDFSLTAGFQVMYGNFAFNRSMSTLEDQLDVGGFVLPTADLATLGSENRHVADVQAGLLYTGLFPNDVYVYAGASVYHLMEPSVGFGNNSYPLNRRYNFHGGGYLPLGANTTLHFSTQYQKQYQYEELMYGGAASYFIVSGENNYEVYAGFWVRNGESYIPYLGLEWNGWRAGFSYDLAYGNSKINTPYSRSTEFSLIYQYKKNLSRRSLRCPVF
ncbi:MAG: PorP/SprF family type IX secretion system membrane protein [Chitinophagaceae bacterium]|jgi:type IX secretion system PorP/SprF family membrane protein|nr:PorP/SprF family type IX secretion system membrane protein [Chitinophagaceae bacterium]MCA6495567.1 PorP/SprF family type IX secretion system membrane protein [Chitinophagaceae bacterium]MCA6499609.1 PorP/SprF family type IX secretion system membrane protein [Chitinophagaceae bacterium]